MSRSSSKDTQETGVGTSKYIQLTVKCEDYMDFKFRVKGTTPMGKLMKLYCKKMKMGAPPTFQFNGLRIEDDDTPEERRMKDGDIIDVLREQDGGVLYIRPCTNR